MSGNADLATLLAMLADYGRPGLHQVAASASPRLRSAGLWFCEVGIQAMSVEEARIMPEADQAEFWKVGAHVGARCIGRDMDPTEAARQCLAVCQETMEGPRGRFLRPVSKALAIAQEIERQKARRAVG